MYVNSLSLKWVPVRIQDLGEFLAPNPWNGTAREKWSINLYTLTSESFATTARWNFINKEQKNKDDLATRRQKLQRKKLGIGKALGIESPDGRIHMLPRVLNDLWQAREVADERLPTLLKEFEPTLKRSDFKMKRLRMIFTVEAWMFLAFSLLALIGFVAIKAVTYAPSAHAQIRPAEDAWLAQPMTEHAIWVQGPGVPAQRCFHLRDGLIQTPSGLTTYGKLDTLCSFQAKNETRLALMEAESWRAKQGMAGTTIILRGAILPPGQLGLSPQLMSGLAQKIPGLNTNLIFVYNVDWAGQTSTADFDELAPILGWAVLICLLPFIAYLIASRFWKARDNQLKQSFRSALGGFQPGQPIQPANQAAIQPF